MTLYVLATVKERLNIPATDTADNTLLNNLGAGIDSEIVNEIYDILKQNHRKKALPEIDTATPLLDGSAPPTSLLDASTNRVVARYHAIHNNERMAAYWEKLSKDAIEQFIAKLEVDVGIWGTVIE